jgi:hypothetical protein
MGFRAAGGYAPAETLAHGSVLDGHSTKAEL